MTYHVETPPTKTHPQKKKPTKNHKKKNNTNKQTHRKRGGAWGETGQPHLILLRTRWTREVRNPFG